MKERLDQYLVKHGFCADLKEAHGLIGAGCVLVNEKLCDKAGSVLSSRDTLRVKKRSNYVSRGGEKLEEALTAFNINVTRTVCVDIGASSGGFTDCLLQHGAAHVFAVDVAYGQFAWKLRQDNRVTVIERFNARNISHQQITRPVDLAVLDASFISLTKLIPPLLPLFKGEKKIIALVKPQFEVNRDKVGNGVVTSESDRRMAVDKIIAFARTLGFQARGYVPSPILGPKGNREYLLYLGD